MGYLLYNEPPRRKQRGIKPVNEIKNGDIICLRKIIEATGFEPTTSASRTQRSTKLSHASIL